jgi:hypothetical protein
MPLAREKSLPIDWSRFEVNDADLEAATNLLLEREVPLTTAEMARAIVERRLKAQEEAAASADPSAIPYVPAERYEVGTNLVFPALGGVAGVVVGSRAGANPDLGGFTVLEVEMQDGGGTREFASELTSHRLNQILQAPDDPGPDGEPDAILHRYGRRIEAVLDRRLQDTPEIVQIAGRWFPSALLAEIHQGHLNLAEAVLDVNGGGPLPTQEMLAHVELPESMDPALAQFSLDYALQQDDRFDEVGPAGMVLWYLRRLEPPEVLFTPPRLESESFEETRQGFTPELQALEMQLDDELTPTENGGESPDEVILPLLFPHWRSGTLPLSARLRPLFPTAYEAPRIRFILVDGHSGERFPGWVVRGPRYVFGLDDWFRRYEIPAGGLVRVRRGEAPGEVIVEAAERRRRNEWIRTAVVRPDGTIGFTMLKQPVGASYEERMVVGVTDLDALDAAWLVGRQRREPLPRTIQGIFLEQAKLNPQTAVHAEALYSAVNVVRRVPPAAVFTCLLDPARYAYVGDLYWRRGEDPEDETT